MAASSPSLSVRPWGLTTSSQPAACRRSMPARDASWTRGIATRTLAIARSSAVHAGQAADVAADQQRLDAVAEGLEVGRLQMGVERRLVLVDLVEDDAIGRPVDRDIE